MNEPFNLKDRIRIVYHPEFLSDFPQINCESPQRIQSILSSLSGAFAVVEPRPCREEDILLCHSQGLLDMEKSCEARFPVALRAAGGAVTAAELALDGFVSFGLIRPPGHHANPDHNWGFCYFNNMAIAIKKLLAEKKISSAVILDIDLHFGDGTDAIFMGYKNVRVLNIQSSNPEDFVRETRSSLAEIRKADIIGISAGFDQYILDWGGNLSTGDYYEIGKIAGEFAKSKARGRIFGVLEGGYYVPDLGKNLLSLLKGMAEGSCESGQT